MIFERIIRHLHATAALLCAALAPLAAQAQCASATSTLSPPISTLVVNSSQNGQVVWTGTLTVSAQTCSAGGTAGIGLLAPTFQLGTNTAGLNGIPGIRATFAYVSRSGTCTFDKFDNYAGTGLGVLYTIPASTTCDATVTWSMTLRVNTASGAISGTISPSQSLIQGAGAYGWGAVARRNVGVPEPQVTVNNGTITVFNSGCTLSSATKTFALPTVSRTSLSTAGAVAGRRPFTLTLNGCTYPGSSYAAVATWSFTPLSGNTGVITNSASAPVASNVGIQLLNANFTPVTNGGTSTLATVTAAGSYTSTFYAQYYATGAAGAGNVRGVATLDISYQ